MTLVVATTETEAPPAPPAPPETPAIVVVKEEPSDVLIQQAERLGRLDSEVTQLRQDLASSQAETLAALRVVSQQLAEALAEPEPEAEPESEGVTVVPVPPIPEPPASGSQGDPQSKPATNRHPIVVLFLGV